MPNGVPSASNTPATRWAMDVRAPTGNWICSRLKKVGRRPLVFSIIPIILLYHVSGDFLSSDARGAARASCGFDLWHQMSNCLAMLVSYRHSRREPRGDRIDRLVSRPLGDRNAHLS